MENMGKQQRPRRSFSDEFKAEVVELVRQPGNTVGSVSRELELTETAVREWVRRADVDSGRRDGLTTADARSSPGCARKSGCFARSGTS